jgi:hypothetical protein
MTLGCAATVVQDALSVLTYMCAFCIIIIFVVVVVVVVVVLCVGACTDTQASADCEGFFDASSSMCTCIFAYIPILHTYLHIRTYLYTRIIHICIYIYIYIYIYIHTHTHNHGFCLDACPEMH